MKPKMYPETKGSHLAGELERDRANKIYERQAVAAKKGFDTVNTQQTTVTTSKKKAEYVRRYLQPSQLQTIERLIAQNGGRQAAEHWLERHPRAKLSKDAKSWAKGALRDMRNPAQSHKSIGFGVAIDFIENYGRMQYPAALHADTVSVDVVEHRSTSAIEKPTQSHGLDVVQLISAMDERAAAREERMFDRMLQIFGQLSIANGGSPQLKSNPQKKEPQEDLLRRDKTREEISKRDRLKNLVQGAAGVFAHTDSDEYHDKIRPMWHLLYERMLSECNINVRQAVSACQARGEKLSNVDWIERNGHMDVAIELALKIWG